MGAPESLLPETLLELYADTNVPLRDLASSIRLGCSPSCFSAQVSNETYHRQIEFASHTSMTHLLRSPRHYQAYLTRSYDDSTPNIGSVIHAKVLEPETFNERYVVWRGAVRRGKEFSQFQQANPGRQILSEKEYVQACEAAESALTSPRWPLAKAIKNGCPEFSVFWIDKETGVPCKVRFDLFHQDFWFDLKTFDDARRKAVLRQIQDMHYDLQVALYDEAAYQFTGRRLPSVLGFLELKSPFEFMPYPVGATILESGRNKLRDALHLFRGIIDTGSFPGYFDDCNEPLEFSARQIYQRSDLPKITP